MKKIVFCALAAFAAHISFCAGMAWYSPAVNAMIRALDRSGYSYSQPSVTLYGSFSATIWEPPTAKYDSMTGLFTPHGSPQIVTSYHDLNEYGKYYTDASVENFFLNCGAYVKDEFNTPYLVYDNNVASFYALYEKKNFEAVRSAFATLEGVYTEWGKQQIANTTELGYDTEKFAELSKEIDKNLKDAQEEINNAIEASKELADNLNKQMNQVQLDLTQISEEAVYDAQRQIDGAVSDFNSFIKSLQAAITKADGEGGEWDDSLFQGAMNELNKSEAELVEAIKSLQLSSQSETVQNAITVISGQLNQVRAVRTKLQEAIRDKDLDKAKSALSDAGVVGLVNGQKSVSGIKNYLNSMKSKAEVLGTLTGAALSAMNEQDAFRAEIEKFRANFSFMFITAMDNFHQINAYLGSTNSMAYVIKRESVNELADFSIDELERWAKISAPDNIDDRYGFGASQLGGRRWNFIYDNLASTYTMWAWPLMDLDGEPVSSMYKFMKHFNLTGTSTKYMGFTEEYSELDGRPEKYWLANGITAPKNWADGKTIKVTNGHYVVVGGSGASVDNVSITTNTTYGAVTKGNASVYGFSTAGQGSVPYKTAEGRVGWVTNSVDGGGLLMLKTGNAPSTVDIIAGYGMKVTKQSGAIQISSTLDTPDSAGAFSSITYISNIEYDTETHSLKVTKTTVSAKILNDGTSQEQTVFIATPHSAEHPSELQ